MQRQSEGKEEPGRMTYTEVMRQTRRFLCASPGQALTSIEGPVDGMVTTYRALIELPPARARATLAGSREQGHVPVVTDDQRHYFPPQIGITCPLQVCKCHLITEGEPM